MTPRINLFRPLRLCLYIYQQADMACSPPLQRLLSLSFLQWSLSLTHTHMYYEEFFFHYVTSMEVCICISRTPLSLSFVCLFVCLFVFSFSLRFESLPLSLLLSALLCVSITRSRSGGGHIYIYTCLFPSIFRSVHTSPQAPYPIRSAQLNKLGRN